MLLGEMTRIPIPVSFGPHEADWWMVAVSAVAAIASIAVAIVAYVTASGARRISSQTELQRIATDQRRERVAYAHRLDDSIVRLFQAIGEHFGPLRTWMDDAEKVEIHGHTDNFGELAYPEDPWMDAIDSHAEAVRMIARDADADVARELAESINVAHNLSGRQRSNHLKSIMAVIREWRAGEKPLADVHSFFEQLNAKNEQK